jgi:hypothetical protein
MKNTLFVYLMLFVFIVYLMCYNRTRIIEGYGGGRRYDERHGGMHGGMYGVRDNSGGGHGGGIGHNNGSFNSGIEESSYGGTF